MHTCSLLFFGFIWSSKEVSHDLIPSIPHRPCIDAGKEYLFVADWGDDYIKCFLPENGIMRKLIRIPGVSTICMWDIHWVCLLCIHCQTKCSLFTISLLAVHSLTVGLHSILGGAIRAGVAAGEDPVHRLYLQADLHLHLPWIRHWGLPPYRHRHDGPLVSTMMDPWWVPWWTLGEYRESAT